MNKVFLKNEVLLHTPAMRDGDWVAKVLIWGLGYARIGELRDFEDFKR